MAIFNYTLPSGSQFRVDTPAGTTQLEADRIFYEQVAAGSLVGYIPGQTLTSAATRLTRFELSRLQRGTAGVETIVVLSTSSTGLSELSDTPTPQTILATIENQPAPSSMPSLADVPLTSPIDQADVDLIKGDDFAPEPVGPLKSYQVQKLLAQTAKLVKQESDQISQDKGIGRYGFTAYALEQAGYVKPGTSAKYFSNGAENFVAVMNSPSVWTGKAGIYSLSDLLSKSETQNKIQVQIMQQGYQQLVAAGTIVDSRRDTPSLSRGQVYTDLGLVSTRPSTNNSVGGLNLSTIASGAIIPNISKIRLDSLTQTISNKLTGDVGSLVVNASKFTPQITSLWANSGSAGLGGIAAGISGLTNFNALAGKGINNIAGSLTGNINNISKTLTNVLPPNLDGLTKNLDVFGKASGFAANFANPLGSLNNLGSLIPGGGIGGALTGQLGNLQGAAAGALGNLQGAAAGALGNLQGAAAGALGQAQALAGNLANFSLPTSLFGGASSAPRVAAGFSNTVNRATVDAAVTRFLGSNKIPAPVYEFPNPASLAAKLDISQAQNFLKNIQGQAGALVGQATSLAGQATSAARGLLG
jgi:hypothetical protein